MNRYVLESEVKTGFVLFYERIHQMQKLKFRFLHKLIESVTITFEKKTLFLSLTEMKKDFGVFYMSYYLFITPLVVTLCNFEAVNI